MSHKISVTCLLLLVSASSATAQSLPMFLSAPALPVPDCGGSSASLAFPGSTSCLRVGGSVWADATLGRGTLLAVPPTPPASPAIAVGKTALSSTRLQARLTFDARTDTAYGPFRAYVSLRVH